ncbi:MAG TPA: FmdB family zinc ribbon protein [Mycobacteriales bacterium]|nr:FmdB family zinc ribbon protein [Mycobacteriales bacterium]
MPTYQYACTACGERHEAVQAFTDPPLTECPACSGRLRKVFSAVGVVFKGSGFYKTDSRGSASGSSAGKDGGSKDGGPKEGAANDGGSKDSTPKTGSPSGSKDGASSAPASTSPPAAKTA